MITDAQAAQKVDEKIKGAIGGLGLDEKLKGITDAIAAASAKPAGKGDDEDKADAKGGKTDPATAAQLKALQASLEEEKTKREAAEEARKLDSMLGAFRGELSKAGVPANRVDHVVAVLHNQQQRLKVGDDGTPGIEYSRDGYKEVVPFSKDVAEFLGSDDGKAFLPPRDVAGTGGGGGNRRRASGDSDGKINSAGFGAALIKAAQR